jgi:hypothetical protein
VLICLLGANLLTKPAYGYYWNNSGAEFVYQCLDNLPALYFVGEYSLSISELVTDIFIDGSLPALSNISTIALTLKFLQQSLLLFLPYYS